LLRCDPLTPQKSASGEAYVVDRRQRSDLPEARLWKAASAYPTMDKESR